MTVTAYREVWVLRWRGAHIGSYLDAQAAIRSSMRLCTKEGLRWPMRGDG